MSSIPNSLNSKRSGHGWFVRLFVAVAVCVAILLTLQHLIYPAKPREFARVRGIPWRPLYRGGAWYWLEQPEGPGARLVRATKSGPETIASADAIARFDADGTRVVWSAREGTRWTIYLAASDGSGKRVLWTGNDRPAGLLLAGGRTWWMRLTPPLTPDGSSLPPLMSTLQAVYVPDQGGTPTPVATLLESEDGEVVGLHDNLLYLSAYRIESMGGTIFYKVPLAGMPSVAGGPPIRIAAETGRREAYLEPNGTLYWLGPSREASLNIGVVCIRRIKPGQKPETVSDWLPYGGKLLETGGGMRYANGEFEPAIWNFTKPTELPQPVALPEGMIPLAVGGGEVLMCVEVPLGSTFGIYRIPMP